jgi:transcriptional regulator NrdR family protein
VSKKVVKKDGRVQPFIKEKIVVSAVKTGAPVEVARKIADKIEKHTKDDIKTDWIRKKVLDELHIQNPDWPKRWYSYDKNIKRLHKYGLK